MTVLDLTRVKPEELERELYGATRPLLVDVCSPSEFASGHLPGAINIPLEQLGSRLRDISWTSSNSVLVCLSGQRAAAAQSSLAALGLRSRVLDGGISAWARAQLPLVRSGASHWALERQVRLAAGLLMLTGVILSLTAGPWWIGLSAFVGLGLTLAGLTGICPMGSMLARMPWNRVRTDSAAQRGAECAR